MAESTSLRYGGSDVEFYKSPTQVALRPTRGLGRSMELSLESMARRLPVERRGRLGRFEVVNILAPAAEVAEEAGRMARTFAIQEQVPVYHTSDDEVPFVPEGTIFLSFKKRASKKKIDKLLTKYDFALISVNSDRYYTVHSSASKFDALETAAKLQGEPIVATAEPDLVTPRDLLDFLPDDELLARQWHLENKGEFDGQTAGYKKGADARVVAAWKLLENLGDPNAVIGIIDDAFDLKHPDFEGKFVNPRDFIRGTDNVQPEPDLHNPQAGDWHGTACAGVAVGKPGGGQIVGSAPNAKFIPVRMTDHLSPIEVEKWFDYLTDKGAWVVSCSWNAAAKVYTLPERVAKAIERCAKNGRGGKGCVVVFAAGNSGKDINDPPNSKNGFAIHPDVIAVAASTSLDRRASYSDTGKEISVCAPSGGRGGWGIATSDATGTYIDADGVERSSGYEAGAYNTGFTGTSSSCPLVAGICSLVLSANPDLTAKQVRLIINATARQIGKNSDYKDGHSTKYGHGCVDAEAAVGKALEAVQNQDVLVALQTDGADSGAT